MIPPALCLFLKIILAILIPLPFHIKFKIILSISIKYRLVNRIIGASFHQVYIGLIQNVCLSSHACVTLTPNVCTTSEHMTQK